MKKILLSIAILAGISSPASAKKLKIKVCVDQKVLVRAVMRKENPSGNPHLVGDKHLRNKAYGLLQIRAPYLADAQKIAGKKAILSKWGKSSLTVRDMIDLAKAKWVFLVYVSHYGARFTRKTGKTPDVEVYARIHNGGPVGWRNKKTASYGKAVKRYADAYQAKRRSVRKCV